MRAVSKWLERGRLQQAAPFLNSPLLDIGCGNFAALNAAPKEYVGIDLSKEMMPGSSDRQIQALLAAAFSLPFANETFQTVLMMAVIEHLEDPEACLQEVARVLRPGGQVVLTTPTPPGDRIHHLLARLGITSSHASAEHVSIFSQGTLKALLEELGFAVQFQRLFLLGGNQICVASLANGYERGTSWR